MDCKFFVKVPPIMIDNKMGEIMYSLHPHHSWLKANGITRYRGGLWSTNPEYYGTKTVTFRFADREDAMAFKLAWV